MAAPTVGAVGTNQGGSGTTAVVSAPAGVTGTSIVVVFMFLDSAPQTITTLPSGFTEAPNSPINVSPTSHGLHVLWARAPAGSTYTFGWGSSAYDDATAIRFDNCVTTGTPFDTPCGTAFDSTNGSTSPPVSTSSLDVERLDVWASTNWSGGAWTPPAGYTEQFESLAQILTCAVHAHPSAGSTGSVTGTCAGSDKRTAWIGALIGTTTAGPSAGPVPQPFHPGAGVLNAARFYRTPRSIAVAASPLVLVDGLADGARPVGPVDTLAVGVLLADIPTGTRAGVAADAVAVGVALADPAGGGIRGASAAGTLAAGVVLLDVASGVLAGDPAGETAVPGVALLDSAAGSARVGGVGEQLATGVVLGDAAGGVRLAAAVDAAAAGVVLVDTGSAVRGGTTGGESATSATVLTDPTAGTVRGGGLVEALTAGLVLADVPGSGRGAGPVEALAAGKVLTDTAGAVRAVGPLGEAATSATILVDPAGGSARVGVLAGSVATGLLIADAAGSLRAGSTTDTVSGSTDPAGLMWPVTAGQPVVVERYTAGPLVVVDRYTAGPPQVV